MTDERVWILDTEGNGSQPGEIIELAAVEMVGLELTGRHHVWRFRPRIAVNYSATRVHGITNNDLLHSPRFEERAREIHDILEDHPIAGHAVHVEVDALRRVLPQWKPRKAYDTLRMARRVYPDLERHRLGHLGDHLGLSDEAHRLTGRQAHSAHYDALLCGLVLRHVIESLDPDARTKLLNHSEIMEIRRQRELRDERIAAKKRLRQLCRSQDFG